MESVEIVRNYIITGISIKGPAVGESSGVTRVVQDDNKDQIGRRGTFLRFI